MAAGSTYVALASNTLSSSAATVTFSAISGAYTDLVLVINSATTASNPDLLLQFNGDTGSNYSVTVLTGNGSAAASSRLATQTSIRVGYAGSPDAAAYFHNGIIQIMNYANTTTYKTEIARSNHTSYGTDLGVGLWRSTAAITSVLVKLSSSSFASGSTFSLYGIAAA